MNKFLSTKLLTLAALVCCLNWASAQAIDSTLIGNITSDLVLGVNDANQDGSRVYGLNGFVFVDPGVTLTILPGTIIKGLKQANITSGDNASALIVRRGARIIADALGNRPANERAKPTPVGVVPTSNEVIIFTAEDDDVSVLDETVNGVTFDAFTNAQWGGLILLGNAVLNSAGVSDDVTPPIQDNIEGLPISDETAFGGTNDNDDSGIVRGISLRHGGAELTTDNEINGLTLGGVGSGTCIDFVEVFANDDDGIEWFGGTVDVKHAVVVNCNDDSFDYDQGSRFNGQFWFSLGDDNGDTSNRAGEHDGATDPETAQPFSIPNISNVTYVGTGGGTGENEIIQLRDAAGGRYRNSIFCESNQGIEYELRVTADSDPCGIFPITSVTQFDLGNLSVANSSYGGGTLFIPTVAFTVDPSTSVSSPSCVSVLGTARRSAQTVFLSAASSNTLDQGCPITGFTRNNGNTSQSATVQVAPTGNAASGTSFSGAFADPFFTPVSYRGAFSTNDNWADWTYAAERGIIQQ